MKEDHIQEKNWDIGGIRLGVDSQRVLEVLGRPMESKEDSDALVSFEYPLESEVGIINFDNDGRVVKVWGLSLNGPAGKFAAGDRLSLVRQKMGEPSFEYYSNFWYRFGSIAIKIQYYDEEIRGFTLKYYSRIEEIRLRF